MDPTAVIVSLIGGLAAVAAAVATARSASRAAQSAQTTALHQIEAAAYQRARGHLEGALTLMQADLDRQAREISMLRRQLSRLARQMTAAGLTPMLGEDETV